MMWNSKFQAHQFPNVKVLYLSGIYDKSATFPYGLFDGFPNLEQLHLSWSSVKVILSSPGLEGQLHHDARKVAPFNKLKLFGLNRLKYIWNERCELDYILQNLETLQVVSCSSLRNLGPSFVSLENLTDLNVSNCHRLINLLTSSTGRTLKQLRKLSIADCNKTEEIITNGEEDVEMEIVFMKLKILELDQLPTCKSFCYHSYTLKFPLLEEVIIEGCPKFEMFCPGFLITPLLKGVNVENNEIHWQCNLSKTIQQLFAEKVLLFRATM